MQRQPNLAHLNLRHLRRRVRLHRNKQESWAVTFFVSPRDV
jgi:hypothetical protein